MDWSTSSFRSARSGAGRSDVGAGISPTTLPTTLALAALDTSFRSGTEKSRRTIADVRNQVAQELAVRAVRKAVLVEGVKIGVLFTLSKKKDELFLSQVARHLKHTLLLQQYLLAVATTGTSAISGTNTLIICGSDLLDVQRAALLAKSKFMDRVDEASLYEDGQIWMAAVRDMGSTSYDEKALWDVVRKASFRSSMEPTVPPPGSKGIDQILLDARARLQRLTPTQAFEELQDPDYPMPALLVDIRPQSQRDADGAVDGSLVIERNHLEWRFDPRCDSRHPIATRYDLRVIIFCQEGYMSSLAAASLHDIGLLNATDIVGGIAAWKAAGLPLQVKPLSSIDSASVLHSQLTV